MKLGFMKDVTLSNTKDTLLFDFQVMGLDTKVRRVYRNVLTNFIKFTGDMLVQDLKPDHVRMYIAYLADHPAKGDQRTQLAGHYAVIRTWIRWLYSQKLLTERNSFLQVPRLRNLFPTRSLTYC